MQPQTQPGEPAPREVGGYRLLEVLGSGGMGTVYRAADAAGQVVALKLLHPGISADDGARARLRREIATLHRVRGPHVARVLDAEAESAEAFVVTELVDGQSLDDSVRDYGALDAAELADLADGLADALDEIHAAGVVHRDMKPGNVMLTDDGPVVIDFGISQLADDARLTQTGLVTGTPGYVDPAVMRGGVPGSTGDWWGWAAVLLFAATGRAPFGRGPLAAVLGRVETGRPDVEGLPDQLGQVLSRALHPDPGRRLEPADLQRALSEHALGQDVTVMLGQDPPATTPVPPQPTSYPPPERISAMTPSRPVPPPPAGEWHQAPVTPSQWGEPVAAPPPMPPAEQPPIPAWAKHPRTRPAVVGAWYLALVALGALWPTRVLIAYAAVLLVTGAVGAGAQALHARRMANGLRRSDRAVTTLASPWYLLSGFLLSVPGLIAGLLAGAVIWGLGAARAPVTGVVALGVAVVLLLAWWTPSSQGARYGTRVVLSWMAPSAKVARIWAGIGALLALVVALVLLSGGTAPVWGPAPQPPIPSF